jgi:hypothetical protein
MKIGDIVKCKDNHYYGIGVIVMERPFGGFIVWFPNSDLACETKEVDLSPSSLEVVNESG